MQGANGARRDHLISLGPPVSLVSWVADTACWLIISYMRGGANSTQASCRCISEQALGIAETCDLVVHYPRPAFLAASGASPELFGNDGAIRSSTGLRGFMRRARAKAMTFAEREPGTVATSYLFTTPDTLPADPRQARRTLDSAADRLDPRSAFDSGGERAERLFGLYERRIAPLMVAAQAGRRRAKAASEFR